MNIIIRMEFSMRKKWFEYVKKIRKKLQRVDKLATHRQAMTAASITWPKEKIKVQNKIKREKRKLAKETIEEKAKA